MKYMALKNFMCSGMMLLLLGACGSQIENTADLKHIYGNTSLKRETPIQDCSKMSEDLKNRNPQTANATNYLKKIVEKILVNNANTFQGVLNPKNICVVVVPGETENAQSFSQFGLIIFSTSLFHYFQSDADVAAVLSHELAHITMNDSEEATNRRIDQDPKYQELTQLGEKARGEKDKEAFMRIIYEKSLRKNALNREMEQQADEIGAEFYLRAGFSLEVLTGIHKNFAEASGLDWEKMLASGQEPDEGTQTHPARLWRIHNLDHLEQQLHAKEHAQFTSNKTITLFPGALEEVKKELFEQ